MNRGLKSHAGKKGALRGAKRLVQAELTPVLTARETHLLALLETELSYAHIAAKLGIRPNTMKTHVKSIFRKLGVRSRHGAVAWYLRRSLTP